MADTPEKGRCSETGPGTADDPGKEMMRKNGSEVVSSSL